LRPKYPKGSEWRKWDLHVHTKSDAYTFSAEHHISSREQNDDEYPKVFVEHINSIYNLGAIAITDHNSANWIDSIIEENKKYAVQNSRQEITIFPGVEVESSDGIHLLVIFNPTTQIDTVKNNHRKINWKETIEHFLTAIELTQGSNASKTTEQIMEAAEERDALCIFAHVTSDKGYFKISSGTSKIRIYKHRLTQIYQIPIGGVNDGQRNIIDGKDTNYCDEQGKQKSVVCITASDTKKLADIGGNNCWIKADSTFEGLKQILYEPQRVYIGKEPPNKIDKDKIISSLSISNSNDWFSDNLSIEFNENLVSVIGGKGTGKTALLDLLAYAAGKNFKDFDEDSFLNKAYKKLKGTTLKLRWADGTEQPISIGDMKIEAPEDKTRYLSQSFVEHLCSIDKIGKLREQIENVVFQKIPDEDKANYIGFTDYKTAQLKIISDKKAKVVNKIEDLNRLIVGNKFLMSKKTESQSAIDKIKKKDAELKEDLKNLIATLSSEVEKNNFEKLTALNKSKTLLEERISSCKSDLLTLEEVKNDISQLNDNIEFWVSDIKEKLTTVNVLPSDVDKVAINLFPETLNTIILTREEEIKKGISAESLRLKGVILEIGALDGVLNLEKSKQDNVTKINEQINANKKLRDSYEEELRKIDKAEKGQPELIAERDGLYINYFELLFEEKNKLSLIYSPLMESLKQSSRKDETLFEFTVTFNCDLAAFAGKGNELIDHKRSGRYHNQSANALYEDINKVMFLIDISKVSLEELEKETIKSFTRKVEELFVKDESGNPYQIADQLKKTGSPEEDFFNWLYSVEYFSINYSIKFNGIALDNLSPGLKGVALLILFLELDKEDTRPLLIDQPEENLDNRSIYETLVGYFKAAKSRRQVIMVTHNPNLVVNTDSEQVIVTNFDREKKEQSSYIHYVSGSLENTFQENPAEQIMLERKGIREHICQILEGGKEAFENREKKYGFKS